MSALGKVCGCSNAEDPVTLHQPSSLRMGGFSPLTSAESHLLDHIPIPTDLLTTAYTAFSPTTSITL